MNTFAILFYIFTSALSLSYMIFGKKQGNAIAFVSGLGLGVIPYFGLEMWQMVLVAVMFMGLPFVLKV